MSGKRNGDKITNYNETKENIIDKGEIKPIKEKYKEEMCPVLFIKNNIIHFNFKGYGLSAEITSKYKISDNIKVEYSGEIGSPDFKFNII